MVTKFGTLIEQYVIYDPICIVTFNSSHLVSVNLSAFLGSALSSNANKRLNTGEAVYVESGSEADYSSLLPHVLSALAHSLAQVQHVQPALRPLIAAPLVSLVEVRVRNLIISWVMGGGLWDIQ